MRDGGVRGYRGVTSPIRHYNWYRGDFLFFIYYIYIKVYYYILYDNIILIYMIILYIIRKVT
jgi:hypothetical protein